MPGIAVFVTSSMAGKLGRRSAMFLRIDASSAEAPPANPNSKVAHATANFDISVPCSTLEGLCGQPALERRGAVNQTHAAVAKFPLPAAIGGKSVHQCIGQA